MATLVPEPADNPAVARAARRLALLEEMAEIGMRILRRLGEHEADQADAAEVFARVSRAVRLTLALEEKTDRFLAQLSAGAAGELQDLASVGPAPEDFAIREAEVAERKASALDLLVAVSESEGESLESFEALCGALAESPDEAQSSIRRDPHLRPIIESLCGRLGLRPELSHKVAAGWDCGYLAVRPRFNPFGDSRSAGVLGARPSRPPFNADAGGPEARAPCPDACGP